MNFPLLFLTLSFICSFFRLSCRDGTDPSAEASSSSAAVQRRKRFSIKPKVAPGRPSALARVHKSPVKAASQTPVEAQDSTASDEPTPSSQTPAPEPSKGPLSPRNRRPSEENKQSKPQPKPSLVRSDCSEPPGVAPAEDAAGSQVKDVTFKVPDKVPPSLPDKEAIVISERAKALVSSKMRLSASPAAFTLSRLLNDRSDLQRLAKAQKLRDLMKKEVHKEKVSAVECPCSLLLILSPPHLHSGLLHPTVLFRCCRENGGKICGQRNLLWIQPK